MTMSLEPSAGEAVSEHDEPSSSSEPITELEVLRPLIAKHLDDKKHTEAKVLSSRKIGVLGDDF